MRIEQSTPDKLVTRHAGKRSFGLAIALGAIALAFAVGLAMIGSSLSLAPFAMTIFVGALLAALLIRPGADSQATFDKSSNRFHLIHKRREQVIKEIDLPLGDIEAVLVDAATGRSAGMRPAIFAKHRITPLTNKDYLERGDAIAGAMEISRFLDQDIGEPELIEQSIMLLARYAAEPLPAIRLARLGKNLSQADAAAYVQQIKQA